MLALALKRLRRVWESKLSQVYKVIQEDLCASEIDVKIGRCHIQKVPIDSGSSVNIMTEDTTQTLGYKTFESTPMIIRLVD